MIFNVKGHIQKIIEGTKTQTRRRCSYADLPRYRIGRTYTIQPGRTKSGIPDGRIKIVDIRKEMRAIYPDEFISSEDAEAEGGYSPEEYEALFKNLNSGWAARFAYTFEFIPSSELS